MNGIVALKKANKYTDLAALGLSSVIVDDANKSITFTLTADGSQHTIHFDQPTNGASIVGVDIDSNNYLICTLSDGNVIKSTNPIKITGTFGEDNKIESISVNDTELTPDTNKNVNIIIPTVSQAEGNQIEQKDDGLFVREMTTKISAEDSNAITEKDDGLYVSTPKEIKISENEGNQLVEKTDGLYVAPTDLTNYSTTDEVKTLIDESTHITVVTPAQYEVVDSATANALEVVADGTAVEGQIDISSVTPLPDGVVVTEGDYVVWVEKTSFKDEKYVLSDTVYSKDETDKKIAGAISDDTIANNSTYSSLKITELLETAGIQTEDVTYAQYRTLTEEQKNDGTIRFITDVDNDGAVTGYTAGDGIEISEDKVISVTIDSYNKTEIDNLIPTFETFFPIVLSGNLAINLSDEDVYETIKVPSTGMYLVVFEFNGIPEIGAYLLGYAGNNIYLLKLIGDENYSKMITSTSTRGSVEIYANDSSALTYKWYKLPFYTK